MPTSCHRPSRVEIAIPVHNEQNDLAPCITRLREVTTTLPWDVRVIILDNASTDDTRQVGEALARLHPDITYRRLGIKGRGNALRTTWLASDADVCAYMDVDLATDLAALAPALAVLDTGHSDICIGSRLSRGARVERGLKREFVSRSYNSILKMSVGARYSDAQCGFKAIRREAAQALLPHVSDGGWFFDTELLTLAQWSGLRIHEIPVDWTDDPNSSVDILATAVGDLKGVARMMWSRLTGRYPLRQIAMSHAAGDTPRLRLSGQVLSFCAIGVLSTLAYMALFLVTRPMLGAQGANFTALLLTALGNTAANRRATFDVRGTSDAAIHHARGLTVFFLGWAITALSLVILHAVDSTASHLTELTVLVLANICSTVLRFVLMRHWVFRSGHRPTGRTRDGIVLPFRAVERPADCEESHS